jgi:transcriptional regulator with XRE-family HTH domain
MEPQALADSLRTRLRQHEGRYIEICRDHGISYSWLTKFAHGAAENPRVESLQRLHDALAHYDTPPPPTDPPPADSTVEPIASDWPGDGD